MSMIVARMQKMKAENLVGIGNHNQRKTKNHSNPDIDTSLSKLNYDLVDRTQNYKTDIENFINENKSTTRAVRKDAVLVNEWIISSDKDFFDNLTESEIENFFERSKDYFAEKFGEKNIRYATVHLDESTPHMHMGIVPFDKDNKLSAKRVFNRQALRDVQEELPKYLQDFQFEIARGQKGSERKNLTVPEFKKLKEEELEIKKELQIKKDELIAYTKENQVDKKLDITPIKEMEDIEIETDEKTLFGKNKTEIVRQWTGNIILSENDYLKLNKEIKKGKKTEGRLAAILETDVYQENKELKNELKDQIDKNDKDIDDYNDLVKRYNNLYEENTSLKSQIGDLKEEIKLIYQSTKRFLKDRISDFKAFKEVFKELADNISNISREKGLDSSFKKEFDRENKKKQTRGIR
ncbi:MobV family relaxase [Mammaliicoccus sciuri]|uniref:Mobilization protein n=1 Tax=Mammaliicoccus sciuri TaxID=1296 RepID=A0AAW5LJI4_MAMSC|nr:MobV family relaxase [Mammaliicoccus sciuri]MCQ9305091.1 plasmid recombination protein [Mammaliicoccus sciuri]